MTTISEHAPSVSDLVPDQSQGEGVTFRTWRRGTGRCVGSSADIAWSEQARVSLPFQRIAVVDVKIRTSVEPSVATSMGDHVTAAALAAATHLDLGTLEIVAVGRCDVPRGVGDRESAEAAAVILAVAAAAGVEISEDDTSRVLASLGHNPAVARRGVFALGQSTGEVQVTSSWRPYFSLLVVHPVEPATYPAEVATMEGVVEAYQSESLEELAALSTRNAFAAYPPGTHPVLDAIRGLDLGEVAPLGMAVSTSGAGVVLLYPATTEGRSRTLAACRKVSAAGLSLQFVVSLTPKPL